MAITTVEELRATGIQFGTQNGETLKLWLEDALARIPDEVPDGPRKDAAVVELVILALLPVGIVSDQSGQGITYRDRELKRRQIINSLTPIRTLTTGDV